MLERNACNMLNIKKFTVNPLGENTYLLWDETLEAAVIDCGAFEPSERQRIATCVAENGLRLTHLLNTHAHFDHLFGADYIYKEWGVKIWLHEQERETYEHAAEQMKAFVGWDIPLPLPPVGRWLRNGEEFCVGHTTLRVIPTPGHTPGGCCFYVESEGMLFSGDSLFRQSIGRTDFPGGDYAALVDSLRERVLTLPDGVRVFPGHGPETSIGYEKEMNAYLH